MFKHQILYRTAYLPILHMNVGYCRKGIAGKANTPAKFFKKCHTGTTLF